MQDAVASPSIDEVLDAFAQKSVIARHPATNRRVRETRAKLARYLAADAGQILDPHQRALLTAEQQFDPDGAATRIFGPDVLVAALPGFLATGRLPRLRPDARAQILIVEALADWVASRGMVGTAGTGELTSAVGRVAEAAKAARDDLNAGYGHESGQPVLPGLESVPGLDDALAEPGGETALRQ